MKMNHIHAEYPCQGKNGISSHEEFVEVKQAYSEEIVAKCELENIDIDIRIILFEVLDESLGGYIKRG